MIHKITDFRSPVVTRITYLDSLSEIPTHLCVNGNWAVVGKDMYIFIDHKWRLVEKNADAI